jgi:hypothetical protein
MQVGELKFLFCKGGHANCFKVRKSANFWAHTAIANPQSNPQIEKRRLGPQIANPQSETLFKSANLRTAPLWLFEEYLFCR